MPTYDYRCKDCATELEVVQKFTEDALTVCPECNGNLRKVYSAVGVVFKGSGFYRTDSRAQDKQRSGNSGSPTSSTSGEKSESKKDSASSSSSSSSDSGGSGSSGSNASNSSGSSSSKSEKASSASSAGKSSS